MDGARTEEFPPAAGPYSLEPQAPRGHGLQPPVIAEMFKLRVTGTAIPASTAADIADISEQGRRQERSPDPAGPVRPCLAPEAPREHRRGTAFSRRRPICCSRRLKPRRWTALRIKRPTCFSRFRAKAFTGLLHGSGLPRNKFGETCRIPFIPGTSFVIM